MPELPVKERRLSELHLPEVTRDDIVHALSELHLPSVELPVIEAGRPGRPALAVPRIDFGKVLGGAVIVRRYAIPVVRRTRWPVAIGAIAILGMVGLAMLRTPAVRERADRATRFARERLETMRAATQASDPGAIEKPVGGAPIDPVASDVASMMAATEDERAALPASVPA